MDGLLRRADGQIRDKRLTTPIPPKCYPLLLRGGAAAGPLPHHSRGRRVVRR
jgi:hypothetical protein